MAKRNKYKHCESIVIGRFGREFIFRSEYNGKRAVRSLFIQQKREPRKAPSQTQLQQV